MGLWVSRCSNATPPRLGTGFQPPRTAGARPPGSCPFLCLFDSDFDLASRGHLAPDCGRPWAAPTALRTGPVSEADPADHV